MWGVFLHILVDRIRLRIAQEAFLGYWGASAVEKLQPDRPRARIWGIQG